MTVHILVQCSKSKSVEPSQSLIWDNEMDHELWNKNWTSSSNRIEVRHLYTGRAIKNERELISSQVDFNGYVISAGAGLVAFDDTIPSYEATFFADDGPDYQNWSTFPNGGLKNLQINMTMLLSHLQHQSIIEHFLQILNLTVLHRISLWHTRLRLQSIPM